LPFRTNPGKTTNPSRSARGCREKPADRSEHQLFDAAATGFFAESELFAAADFFAVVDFCDAAGFLDDVDLDAAVVFLAVDGCFTVDGFFVDGFFVAADFFCVGLLSDDFFTVDFFSAVFFWAAGFLSAADFFSAAGCFAPASAEAADLATVGTDLPVAGVLSSAADRFSPRVIAKATHSTPVDFRNLFIGTSPLFSTSDPETGVHACHVDCIT
jgi:hypothetical protein